MAGAKIATNWQYIPSHFIAEISLKPKNTHPTFQGCLDRNFQIILLIPSSMLSKNKYVSSLDLKLLGAKFITIPDSHLEISTSFSSIRKSKNYQLPSILTTMPDQEHIPHGDLSEAEEKEMKGAYKKHCKTGLPSIQKYRLDEAYSERQKQEIAKYRNIIGKLKQDNETIHKEIKNLYREQKLNTHEPKTKAIRNIAQVGKQVFVRENRFRLSPEARKYQHIYEDLGNQENPYRKQSLEIQKKFSSNNIHKSFESFLLNHNKRVPQFIKNIR